MCGGHYMKCKRGEKCCRALGAVAWQMVSPAPWGHWDGGEDSWAGLGMPDLRPGRPSGPVPNLEQLVT